MWEQEQASYWKDQARKEARRRKILLIVALLAASVFMAVRWMRKGEDKGFFARTVIVKKPELNQEHIAWVFLFCFYFYLLLYIGLCFWKGWARRFRAISSSRNVILSAFIFSSFLNVITLTSCVLVML